jgi:hypothetical protein
MRTIYVTAQSAPTAGAVESADTFVIIGKTRPNHHHQHHITSLFI